MILITNQGLTPGLTPGRILLDFLVSTAVAASLFLNGIAAISAAITYFRKNLQE